MNETCSCGRPRARGEFCRHCYPNLVQHAVAQGVTTHEENGVTVADTAVVLRIARAVAKHRKGLMDRLAR